jgi:hypothetical protein
VSLQGQLYASKRIGSTKESEESRTSEGSYVGTGQVVQSSSSCNCSSHDLSWILTLRRALSYWQVEISSNQWAECSYTSDKKVTDLGSV